MHCITFKQASVINASSSSHHRHHGHPVVVDDEIGASPFFLRSLWLTMNNRNSERHAICCDRQQVFPVTVERCGSPLCHAWWRLCSAVWVCQFYEARYRTRRRGYPWAGDHLPYGGRGLASADIAAYDSSEVIWTGEMQDGGVADMIPPRDTKNGAKTSEMKCIEPVFLAAVCAPRLAAV